jgi:hypothetical protein
MKYRRGKVMEIGHSTLPLRIKDDRIVGPKGIIGHLNYGDEYLYVCLFENKLIVSERDKFNSRLTELVSSKIDESYYYAFKILCNGGLTAIVKWDDDVILVGVTSGHHWTSAADIKAWPGKKEIVNETGRSS